MMSRAGRVSSARSPKAHLYVLRGICVCERWMTYDNFLEDMGEAPDGLSLDRIDNERGYEPGNCRWADAITQRRNSRSRGMTFDQVQEVRGRFEHGESMQSIADRLGFDRSCVSRVVNRINWSDVP